MIFNTSVELRGDVAHTETYWQFFGENRVKPNILAIGRYVDRFERRDGRWAIAARVCISECVNRIEDCERRRIGTIEDSPCFGSIAGDDNFVTPGA